MSERNDFFKKFISKSDYQTQKAIRDVMLKHNAYETALPTSQRSNKTYLRNIHIQFFSKWYNIVQDCEYSETSFDDNIAELDACVEQIMDRKQEYQQQTEQELKDFDEMLNEIDEEIHRKQEEIDQLKQIKREEINKVKQLGIENGGVTADKKFSLDATRCIGCCGLAPVMTINEEVYGKITAKDVARILAKYND